MLEDGRDITDPLAAIASLPGRSWSPSSRSLPAAPEGSDRAHNGHGRPAYLVRVMPDLPTLGLMWDLRGGPRWT